MKKAIKDFKKKNDLMLGKKVTVTGWDGKKKTLKVPKSQEKNKVKKMLILQMTSQKKDWLRIRIGTESKKKRKRQKRKQMEQQGCRMKCAGLQIRKKEMQG